MKRGTQTRKGVSFEFRMLLGGIPGFVGPPQSTSGLRNLRRFPKYGTLWLKGIATGKHASSQRTCFFGWLKATQKGQHPLKVTSPGIVVPTPGEFAQHSFAPLNINRIHHSSRPFQSPKIPFRGLTSSKAMEVSTSKKRIGSHHQALPFPGSRGELAIWPAPSPLFGTDFLRVPRSFEV